MVLCHPEEAHWFHFETPSLRLGLLSVTLRAVSKDTQHVDISVTGSSSTPFTPLYFDPMSRRPAFTVIELLLAIGIVVLLVCIAFVIILPRQQFAEARDGQRRTDANTILTAVYQYSIENEGVLPGSLSGSNIAVGTAYQICQSDMSRDDCTASGGYVRLDGLVGVYLSDIPRDPLMSDTGTGSHYTITKVAGNRLRLCAPFAEDVSQGPLCVTK